MLRKNSKKHVKTLSEKVAELIVNPHDKDNSDDDNSSANEATAPRVADFDEDEYDLPAAQSTEFRKRNVKLLSEQSRRYSGKITTRKEAEQLETEDEADEDDSVSRQSSDESDVNEQDEAVSSSDDADDAAALKAFSKKLKATAAQATNGHRKQSSRNSDDDSDDLSNEYQDADDSEDDGSEDVDADDSEDDDAAVADSEIDDDSEDDFDAENSATDEDNDDEMQLKEKADIMTATNRDAEIQKGLCVQNQLRIWERLLELRIHSQKLLAKGNQLPAPAVLKQEQATNVELQQAATECCQNVHTLLKTLLQLQTTFMQQNSEIKKTVPQTLKRAAGLLKSAKNDETLPPPTKRFSEHLALEFNEFKTHRNAVLLKWDDRTKLLTPGVGAKKKSMQEDYDIVQKIENALLNRSALIAKSQSIKIAAEQPQQAEADAESVPTLNVHIYDDSDFYHQQLRELIEHKSNTSANLSEVTKQYVELQKLRQKMKKKVDTRASKGRKLRYVVHNKLLNFMAPDERALYSWTDESKNELYKSLFAS